MPNTIDLFDSTLRESKPEVHADMQPGVKIRFGTPDDLRQWFSWRNGQPFRSERELFGTYTFVNYETAIAELSHMRSTLWKSPLNFLILLLLNRRVFYTIPLLTDIAGDGYCYDLIRRRPYYRFKGERDVPIPTFEDFLRFLIDYVQQESTNGAQSVEERFLQPLY
ncbi:hypothetical protein AB1L42_16715 [Thalassoglobus sp. JC818]|uniref:hypothetical protein n=1 Tax=Thalassoglobus sp. JC818 TaxID=3232136 RepID=UPI0034576C8E